MGTGSKDGQALPARAGRTRDVPAARSRPGPAGLASTRLHSSRLEPLRAAPAHLGSAQIPFTRLYPPQPLMAPAVKPATMCFWKNTNSTITGITVSTLPADSMPQE